MSGEGFLSRWARLKSAQGQRREPEAAQADGAETKTEGPASTLAPGDEATGTGSAGAEAPAGAAPAAPTAATAEELPAIDSLTPESDFRPFMQRGVEPGRRASALKRLFADPHFNVMDGLDVYIDDYGKPDPIPPAMLRELVQARSLGLFDDAPPGAGDDAGEPLPAPTGGSNDPGEAPSDDASSGAAAPDAIGVGAPEASSGPEPPGSASVGPAAGTPVPESLARDPTMDMDKSHPNS